MTIRHMHFACWIPKATNTRPEYLILIAFPLQQWLHERATMLRYTYSYIACLVESPLGNEKSITAPRTTRHYDQLPTDRQTDRGTRVFRHVSTLRSNGNWLMFIGEYTTYTHK